MVPEANYCKINHKNIGYTISFAWIKLIVTEELNPISEYI